MFLKVRIQFLTMNTDSTNGNDAPWLPIVKVASVVTVSVAFLIGCIWCLKRKKGEKKS